LTKKWLKLAFLVCVKTGMETCKLLSISSSSVRNSLISPFINQIISRWPKVGLKQPNFGSKIDKASHWVTFF